MIDIAPVFGARGARAAARRKDIERNALEDQWAVAAAPEADCTSYRYD